MNILNLLQSPVQAAVFLLAIISAVCVHEFAHAWTAYRLGDETPYLQGRVTLSPAAHLDLLGSLAFLLLGFGWGKPVIYNPMRLKRATDELLVALAGPASNLLFAIFLNLIIHVAAATAPVFSAFLGLAAAINVALAAFNLIPIPPLDGSSVVAYFWPQYRSALGGQVGLMILLAVLVSGILSFVLTPVQAFLQSLTHLFNLL